MNSTHRRVRIGGPLAVAASFAACAACFACFACLAGPARAQDVTQALIFDDYGFTLPLSPGARAAAMAGAVVAAGDDVHSLVSNPAGLARVERIELALGLQQERVTTDDTFYGSSTSIDTRDGGVDAVAVAIPVPTYRGSFVAAAGVYRLYSGRLDLGYSGANARDGTHDNYLLQQGGSVYSYNLGIGVDLSPGLSGGVSAFKLDGTIDALTQYGFQIMASNPSLSVFVDDDASHVIDGYGGRVGLQATIHPLLRIGVVFVTPVVMKSRSHSTLQVIERVENGIDTFTQSQSSDNAELLLPYRVDIGVASAWRGLSLRAGIGYCDWTETSIGRKRFRTSTLDPVFREVIDYRFGLEWSVGRLPLRLRAGYALRPYPLVYLQGDRIDNEDFTRASIDSDRHQLAVGVGGLVGGVLTVDAAYVRTSGRRSIATYADQRTTDRFLVSAGYRF